VSGLVMGNLNHALLIHSRHKNTMETQEITIKGEMIESFERVEQISEIIILGKNGGIRRIILR
jgi:hypothetical protein